MASASKSVGPSNRKGPARIIESRGSRVLLLVLVLVVAAVLEKGRQFYQRSSQDWADAVWIWSISDDVTARRIYLVRDFEWQPTREQAEQPVVVDVVVDREHHLFLNGVWVGGDSYSLSAQPSRYDVSHLMVTGANRLVVEARAPRPGGGVLLRLSSGVDPIVVSDERWSVESRWTRGLVAGWTPLSETPPRVWGAPPSGRWRLVAADGRSPGWRPTVVASHWFDVEAVGEAKCEQSECAAQSIVRFGTTQRGLLEVSWQGSAEHRIEATFRTARDATASTTATLTGIDGQNLWRDATPRTFDSVTFQGEPIPARVRVRRVEESGSGIDPDKERALFGLRAPPGRDQ